MSHNAKRFGAYHRISRMNGRLLEDESTISDKDAFDQMDAWAKVQPGRKIADRYLDTDQSGSKLERPELDRLLADLDAGVIDGIVVAQVDRLSRADVGDALTVVKRIVGDDANHPRPLVILDLGIDPSTEFGEFGLTILLALARMQWRRYKRQWESAQTRACERGLWIGPAPLGYTKHEGRLVRDEISWRGIRDAFEIAAADGLPKAAKYLATVFPAQRWRLSDARRVLSNRAYLGEHHNGGPGHQSITNASTFAAAQTEPRSRRDNGEYPLTGQARCDKCGEPIVGALQTVRERTYRRMRCSANGCGSISAEAFERHVHDRVKERLGNKRWRGMIEPVGKEEAEQKLADARWDFEQFVTGTAGMTGEAIALGAATRQLAIDVATEELREVAEASARRSVVPAASELADPEQLVRAIRAAVVDFRLIPGRGPVEDRVVIRFVGDDLEDDARVLAA